MYIPEIFAQNDPEEIKNFIREHALGVLISQVQLPEPLITHLPFILKDIDGSFVLETHLANKNPHLQHLKTGKPSTVVFQGSNTYISSSLYSHQNVPTWNYQAVHVFGTVEVMSASELVTHLTQSVDFFEGKRHQSVHFSEMNQAMVSGFLKQITGIKLTPYKLEAKYKLSQNRNESDFKAVVDDLQQSSDLNDKLVAVAMERVNPHSKKPENK